MPTKKNKYKRNQKRQSKTSKMFSTVKSEYRAKLYFFENFSTNEIVNQFHSVAGHRYFRKVSMLTMEGGGIVNAYRVLIPDASLEKYVAWSIGLINFHQDRINTYVRLKTEVEKCLRENDVDQVFSLAKEIENCCGQSVWGCKLKSRALQLSGREGESLMMFSENEAYSSNKYLSYILDSCSNRLSDEKYYATVSNATRRAITESQFIDIRDHLLYSVFSLELVSVYDFKSIFYRELQTSIVDIFNLLVEFSKYALCSEGGSSDLRDIGAYAVKKIGKNINYVPLKNMLYLIGESSGEKGWSCNRRELSLLDYYTGGNYGEVCKIANTDEVVMGNFTIFEVIAKANSRLGAVRQSNTYYEVILHVQNVLTKSEGWRNSLRYLDFISNVNRFDGWYAQLFCFVQKETPFLSKAEKLGCEMAMHIHAQTQSPIFSKFLEGEHLKEFLQEFFNFAPASNTLYLYKALLVPGAGTLKLPRDIQGERGRKFEAQFHMSQGCYIKVIEIAENFKLLPDRISRIEMFQLYVEALLAADRAAAAVGVFSRECIKEIQLVHCFDTESIANIASELIAESNDIAVPIALSLHSRFASSSHDSSLRYAFESFLINNGVDTPEDLIKQEGKFGVEELRYFLRWVCVPEVMKLYFKFETKKDTEICRLNVLSHLVEAYDGDDSLQAEIVEINKQHIIRRAARRVDSSRIYADTSIFYDSSREQYRSMFDRYIELSKKEQENDVRRREISDLVASMSGDIGILFAVSNPKCNGWGNAKGYLIWRFHIKALARSIIQFSLHLPQVFIGNRAEV